MCCVCCTNTIRRKLDVALVVGIIAEHPCACKVHIAAAHTISSALSGITSINTHIMRRRRRVKRLEFHAPDQSRTRSSHVNPCTGGGADVQMSSHFRLTQCKQLTTSFARSAQPAFVYSKFGHDRTNYMNLSWLRINTAVVRYQPGEQQLCTINYGRSNPPPHPQAHKFENMR